MALAHAQVLLLGGPYSEEPGQVLRVVAAWNDLAPQGLGALHPWDCAWCPGMPGISNGPLLFVTRHTDVDNNCCSRVTIYCATSGACLREISQTTCPELRKASMMALDFLRKWR